MRIVLNTEELNQKADDDGLQGGDTVAGTVEVETDSLVGWHITVFFQGFIRTWLPASTSLMSSCLQRTREYKFLEERQDLEKVPLQSPLANARHNLRLPFEFVIPHQLISPYADIDSAYLNLLPTVKEGTKFQNNGVGPTFMPPMIFYSITGSAGTKKTKSRCTREIKVMPSIPALPPLQIMHFPREYETTCRKELKRHIWSSTLGSLRVSAEEPQPLNLSSTAPRASTLASVNLSFRPSKTYTRVIPPDWTVTVRYFLRSRTFYTTQPLTEIPNLDTVQSNPLVQMTTETTPPEVRQSNKLTWHLQPHPSPEPSLPNDSPLLWTTTLKVPVNASKTLIPTFLSPLSARRYALVMQIAIAPGCRQTLALELPIQVLHHPSSTGGDGGNPVSDVTGDCIDPLTLDGIMPPSFEESCAFKGQEEMGPPVYHRC